MASSSCINQPILSFDVTFYNATKPWRPSFALFTVNADLAIIILPTSAQFETLVIVSKGFGRTGGRVGTVNNRTRFCSQLLNQMRFFCRKRPKPGRLTSRKGQLKLQRFKTQSWKKTMKWILFDLKSQLVAFPGFPFHRKSWIPSKSSHQFIGIPQQNLKGKFSSTSRGGGGQSRSQKLPICKFLLGVDSARNEGLNKTGIIIQWW